MILFLTSGVYYARKLNPPYLSFSLAYYADGPLALCCMAFVVYYLIAGSYSSNAVHGPSNIRLKV